MMVLALPDYIIPVAFTCVLCNVRMYSRDSPERANNPCAYLYAHAYARVCVCVAEISATLHFWSVAAAAAVYIYVYARVMRVTR